MKWLHQFFKLLFSLVATQKISLGGKHFSRWRFIPNKLAKSSEEQFLDDIYKAILNVKKGVFIDVGVNIGQTLLKVLEIDSSREYIGFEAQLAPSFFVEQFLIDNQLKNFRVFSLALSNQFSLVPLLIRGTSSITSSASIVEGFRPNDFYTYSKLVYAVPGDEIIPHLKLDEISTIKIDVEGAELEVIEGMINCIETYRPFILFEVLHHFLVILHRELDAETIAFREARIAKIESLLRSRSYAIYQIYGQEEIRKVATIKPEKVSNLSTANYLAVPETLETSLYSALERTRRIKTTFASYGVQTTDIRI